MQRPLSQEQQQQAQELAAAIAEAAQEDLLLIAQKLVATAEGSPFGETEFQIRDIILRVAAKAYEQHLTRKKTDIREPA